MDSKILLVENNNNIKILNYENNILSLYTNIETKEDKNFVGIEISNKFYYLWRISLSSNNRKF